MADHTARIEHDMLGEKAVPADAYYGVQTARALENFHISGVELCLYPDLNRALLIGYEHSTELAAEAMRTGRGILELVREKKVLTEEQIAKVLDPLAMTGSRRADRIPSSSGLYTITI